MEITFLGTANAFGHSGSRNSCYLVRNGMNIVIDAGPGLLSALRENQLSMMEIDIIILSHLHPDHYLGLPQAVLEDYYVLKRKTPISIFCPPGTKDKLLEIALVMYDNPVANHTTSVFDFHETKIGEVSQIKGGKIDYLPANHSGNARMIYLELRGKTLGYTGDTSYHESSFSKLLEADIIITEASSAGFRIPDHMSLEDVLALDIQEGSRVYLSHLGQSVLDRGEEITPPFFLASDNLRVQV